MRQKYADLLTQHVYTCVYQRLHSSTHSQSPSSSQMISASTTVCCCTDVLPPLRTSDKWSVFQVLRREVSKYRVIKKSVWNWWIQYRKLQVMLKMSPVILQTFIDTRLTLTPSVIRNSNYVITVSDWKCLKYFCLFFVLHSSGAQRLLATL
jgi:hypothetical protein